MGHGELLDLMIYDGLQDPYSGRHMGEIADTSAARHGLSREAQDEYAIRSYQRSQKAVKEGIFKDEIVPVVKKTRKGEEVVAEDEEPFKVDFEKLKGYRAAGVNRLNIGAQSFQEQNLAMLGRIHSAEQAHAALPLAKQGKFGGSTANYPHQARNQHPHSD